MITDLNKIVNEWAYRVDNGMPNPKNALHIVHLKESMQHLKIDEEVIDIMINALNNDIISEAKGDTSATTFYHEVITGIIVMKIPANNFDTSKIGNHVKPFLILMEFSVIFKLIKAKNNKIKSRMIFSNSKGIPINNN